MKARIKNYLSVTKKEWNGMVILVILIAGVLAAPYIYQVCHKDSTINYKDFDKAVAQLSKAGYMKNSADSISRSNLKVSPIAMFAFNPNNLTVKQWQQLGLSAHQANIINHYEAKGGRFYSKEDVKKIYGLTADDYKRLEPYINIPGATGISAKANKTIEINGADSAGLTQLRGIGPSFAVQIIRYRNRLGGFINKEQLMEVYGIDSSVYAQIMGQLWVNPKKISKLHINTISFNQLRIFPYLGYKQVNAIIQYRTQHGNYSSINDMRNIAILDEKILLKIEPYIVFE
jgi:competence protein ComEA